MLANTENIVKKINLTLSKTSFGDKPKELYEPIDYMLALGGKRMRPLVSVLSYLIFKEDYEKAIKPSLSLEVFHNFTLMHDDIMDQAPLRRGQATVHEKWNPNTAILSGDVMLVKAYDLLLDLEPEILKQVVTLFNQCATQVCEGQQLDMLFEKRNDVTVEEYLEMIRLKTAVLLGFSMQLGGIIAGASKKDADYLYKAGVDIGIGFQLKDDLLDTFGDPAKFGKKVGGDIIANKKTFLMIHALEVAQNPQKEELRELVTFSGPQKVERVLAIYKSCGVDEWAMELKEKYLSSAYQHLEDIAVVSTRKKPMIDLARFLVQRDY